MNASELLKLAESGELKDLAERLHAAGMAAPMEEIILSLRTKLEAALDEVAYQKERNLNNIAGHELEIRESKASAERAEKEREELRDRLTFETKGLLDQRRKAETDLAAALVVIEAAKKAQESCIRHMVDGYSVSGLGCGRCRQCKLRLALAKFERRKS